MRKNAAPPKTTTMMSARRRLKKVFMGGNCGAFLKGWQADYSSSMDLRRFSCSSRMKVERWKSMRSESFLASSRER